MDEPSRTHNSGALFINFAWHRGSLAGWSEREAQEVCAIASWPSLRKGARLVERERRQGQMSIGKLKEESA